ncbi:hypothetical protein LPJ61_003278 [Coemansia biformis]|uniref:BZIP domain-containing protein n=1 Tax=Coemansia biformis TaxID=1286918 RepID=A0A9W7YBQ0_9FUNG|nr:hypothetical protein LPJ61_003278 [Coemansia biformis]
MVQGGGVKRKHSAVIVTPSGEIDLSLLDPPRPGRPCRQASQDPAMQEARKRARVLRNRAAAQMSREKKRQHVELLELENAELKSKNAELEGRLGKAEDANAGLSARLDGLARQLQSFQALLLGAQRQSPAIDNAVLGWGGALVAPPAHSAPGSFSSSLQTFVAATSPPAAAVAIADAAATPYVSSPLTLVGSSLATPPLPISKPEAADPSLLSAIASTLAPSASARPSAATVEMAPDASAAADLSGKGLSESAALEQSGAHIYCVVPDSQQRMPLPSMESICPKQPGLLKRQSLAMRETCSSASSSGNWGQRMASVAVAAVLSASAKSNSPQVLWSIFCALWWVLRQSGGWVSKHQISRIARGILDCPPRRPSDGTRKTPARANAAAAGLASLALVAAWLGPGARTAAALRRVVGDDHVDQVYAFVVALRAAARAAASRRQRLRASGIACDKHTPLLNPP